MGLLEKGRDEEAKGRMKDFEASRKKLFELLDRLFLSF
jgi:hypothetical protein